MRLNATFGRTIQLFLVDGKPSGLRTERHQTRILGVGGHDYNQ